MTSIQLSQDRWIKKIEMACQAGSILCIESIDENIDAILDPLLSRQFIKKGKNYLVKLGAEEVQIQLSTFRLYL